MRYYLLLFITLIPLLAGLGLHMPRHDVAKAFGAGSDFVMVGSMLAGHNESGGGLSEKDGKRIMIF